MIRFDHQAFLDRVGVVWGGPVSLDLNDDFVALHGEVVEHPTREALERAFVDLGFSFEETTEEPGYGMVAFYGRLLTATLKCALFDSTRLHGPKIALAFRSGRRPPIKGDTIDWAGRTWPVILDHAEVFHRSSTLLIIEGKPPEDGIEGCFARYRAWSKDTGFGDHVFHEPGLYRDLAFTDGEFVLTVDNRSPVLLTIRREDAGGD